MVLSDSQVVMVTAWIFATYFRDVAQFALYLHITSPTIACGKSRLMQLLRYCVQNPWHTASTSAANLVRRLDRDKPTALLDELDAQLSDTEVNETLRGVLNAGYDRETALYSRCDGQGAGMTSRDFDVFGFKALGGIGQLPPSVASRAATIRLQRRRRSEPVEKLRGRDVKPTVTAIRAALDAAARAVQAYVRDARPAMPPGLDDRAEDVLEVPFAAAEAAGPWWARRVRQAAVALMGADDAVEVQYGVDLLRDVRIVFAALKDPDTVRTSVLLERLHALPERRWKESERGGKELTDVALARRLSPFGIRPDTIRSGDKTFRGYYRSRFDAAWDRYTDVPPAPSPPVSGSDPQHLKQANEDGPELPKINPKQDGSVSGSKNAGSPDKHWVVSGVSGSNPKPGGSDNGDGVHGAAPAAEPGTLLDEYDSVDELPTEEVPNDHG
jgi:hypothetical protein